MSDKQECEYCKKQRRTKRDEKEVKDLQCRIKKIVGQLNGISKMIEDNRYCGDVLIQISAVESALQSLGYKVLKSHMESCVVDDIKAGKTDVIDETVDLIKRLK